MNNIYLCGFMGCGKKTIGRLLAHKLKRRFLDLDTFIEKRTKQTVIELVKSYGLKGYQQVEALVLEEVCLMKDAVVAMGDVSFSYEQNIIAAKNSGKIIYLSLPFGACYRRIKDAKGRTIVSKATKNELNDIYHKRHTIYKIAADYIYEPKLQPQICAKHLAEYINL